MQCFQGCVFIKRQKTMLFTEKRAVMNLDIHEKTASWLKMVISFQDQLQNEKRIIRQMKSKRVGLNYVVIDPETRIQMLRRAVSKGNVACSRLYDQMNKERIAAGFSELENPYK